MALDFEANFQDAIRQAQDFQLQVLGVGKALDALEGKAKGSAHTKLFTAIRKATDEASAAVNRLGEAGETAAKGIGNADKQITRALGNISNRYVQAATQASGFADKSDHLHNVLSNTARLDAYSKWQRQIAALYEEQAGRAEFLEAKLRLLRSAEGKRVSTLEVQTRAADKANRADAERAAHLAETQSKLKYLQSAEGKRASVLEVQVSATQKANRADVQRREQVKELKREIAALDSIAGRQIIRLKEEYKTRVALAGYLERQAGKTALLRKEVEFLDTAEGKEQVRLSEQAKGRRELAGYLEKQANKMALLIAEAEHLASTEGQAQVRQEAQNRATRAQIGYLERMAARTAELRAQKEFLASAEGQEQLQLEMSNKASRQAATFLERQRLKTAELEAQLEFLTGAEGRYQAQLEQRVRAQRKANQAEGQGASAMDAHVQARQRQIEITRLLLALQQRATKAQREMAVTGERLAFGYERLTQAQAAYNAQQERAKAAIDTANRAMVEGEQALHRYTGANATAERAVRRLADEEARANARRRAELAELRRAIEERDRADKAYQQTAERAAEATRKIGAAEARTRVERERAVDGTRAYNDALLRAARAARDAEGAGRAYWLQLRRLNETMLTSSAERLNQQFVHLAASGRNATSSLHALTQQQAALTASEERANRLLELRNRLTMEQARASERRSGSEAALTRQLEQQIAVQTRRNRLASMTTTELLGLSTANARAAKGFRASAQAAAMFRAGLTGLHTSIGIYTGGTVLAAAATYAVAAALRGTISAGMEFTETMSRAEAVMMTSVNSFTAAGRSMESAEMMVRALGASTVFTATEVSGGLVDLGMAGLSASDAMTALAPSLDLAAIGGIEMSRAADIATNVMTSFNLSASDLTEVVDVMATAITNSNTNIEQLAGALSYVGPAAKAAGFELRDTVAAIELLSSAGIKASKAGTGLRRFMLNIQNPTAKGTAVMERYGISIVDAEGQTRSMIDILGQFNRALHNDAIKPAERTAAVMDLVGVRAQSAVSRMIGSFEEFGALRRQLDEVEGAAAAMRKTMEDNLTADWKQLKSVFQDVQLDVFDAYDEHLRELAARWTNILGQMQQKVGEIEIGGEMVDYDGVDVFIAKLERLKDTVIELKPALYGFLTLKGVTFLKAGAENTTRMSQNLTELASRFRYNREAAAQYSLALGGLTSRFKAHVANVANSVGVYGLATKGLNGLGFAAHYAAKGLAWAATAAGYFLRAASMVATAFGWVGIVWGAYTAITTLFSKDTEQRIEDHNRGVEASEARYKKLQAAIEATTEARMRAALEERKKEAETELGATNQGIAKLRVALEYVTDADARQHLEDQLLRQEQRAKDLENQINDTSKALGQIGINQAQYQQMEARLTSMASLYAANQMAIEDMVERQAKLARQGREFRREARNMEGELTDIRDITVGLEGVMALLGHRIDDTRGKVVKFTEMTRQAVEAQRRALDDAHALDNMSVQEKLNNLLLRRQEIMDEMAKLDVDDTAGLDTWQRLNKKALEIGKELHEVEMERREAISEILELERERQDILDREEPTLTKIQARLREIREERQALFDMAASGEEPLDLERIIALREEENEKLKTRNSLLDEGATLLDKLYPARTAQRKYKEDIDKLNDSFDYQIGQVAELARKEGVLSAAFIRSVGQVMNLTNAYDRLANARDRLDKPIDLTLDTQRAELQAEYALKQVSSHQQLAILQGKQLTLKARLAKLDKNAADYEEDRRALHGEILDTDRQIIGLEQQRSDEVRRSLSLHHELNEVRANEEATMAGTLARIREIQAERQKMADDAHATGVPKNQERYNELLEEEKGLTQQLNQLREEARSAAQQAAQEARQAAQERLAEIQQMLEAYRALRDEIYPLEASQRRFREEVELIGSAYDHLVGQAAEAARVHGVLSEQYLAAQDALFDYNQVLEDHYRLRAFTDEDPADVYPSIFDPDKAEDEFDAMDEFAKNAAENIQNHFADFLFDPFAEGLDGMLEGFTNMVKKMIAEAVAADLTRRLFGSVVEGGEGNGLLGTALNWAGMAMGMSGGSAMSYASTGAGTGGWAHAATFDGGGFTGWGARAGGLDGKGGFMAMLHPQETVVDHTKGGSSTNQQITNNFLLQERKDNRTQRQLALQAASGQRRANARFGA